MPEIEKSRAETDVEKVASERLNTGIFV
jgi:hypothetical protein